MKKLVLILGVILICTSSVFAQKSLTRFKKLKGSKVDTSKVVKMNIISTLVKNTEESKPAYKTIFDLNAEGQAAVLANKKKDEIYEILNMKFQKDVSNDNNVVDLTKKNIQITFSTHRNPSYDYKNFTAYDRIEFLKYNFKISDSINKDGINAKIVSWNKFYTEYGVLDIGTLEYNQSFSAGLDAIGKIVYSKSEKRSEKIDENNSKESNNSIGPEFSLNGKASYTSTKKENQNIKQSYIQLTGMFNESEFTIEQQGLEEKRLEGNTSIDMTISFENNHIVRNIAKFNNLFNDKNFIYPADSVKLKFIKYKLPDMSVFKNGLEGTLSYEYVIRHINKKYKTKPEMDDKITFIIGENKLSDVCLIKEKDIVTPIYSIRYNNSVVKIKNECQLNFILYDEAMEFKSWLIQTILNTKDKQIKILKDKQIEIENFNWSDSHTKEELEETFKVFDVN